MRKLTKKDQIKLVDNALEELTFARHNPLDCGDNHSDEYRNRANKSEHTNFHITLAFSELEVLREGLKNGK